MTNRDHRSRIRSDDVVLPEDVLIKVFSWLPVKSLLRIKCLSKRWFDIVSNDYHFFQLHLQQSKSKPLVLFTLSGRSPKRHCDPSRPMLTLLQSSKDMQGNLLNRFEISDCKFPLWLPTRFDLVCFKSKDKFYVCNPSTHELITLPSFRGSYSSTFGFGYVQSTDEYKIVHFIEPYNSCGHYVEAYDPDSPVFPRECRIFTLGMRKDSPSSYASPWAWRHAGNSPYNLERNRCPAFVDGALHWLINRMYHSETILAFNLETEEFRLVQPPRCCSDPTRIDPLELQLVELIGLLCVSYVIDGKMDIWMLKDYHYETCTFSWAKEYCIDLNPVGDNLSCYYFPELYAARDIQDDGNKVLIQTSDGRPFYFDSQTASSSDFICEQRSFLSFYIESLRSLRYVLRKSFMFDQITGATPSQSQQLELMDPPIYIMRVFALFHHPDQYGYGGYLTNFSGGFVAIEGKRLDAGDSIEAEAKVILNGLQFARRHGVRRIALVSKAKELIDAIISGEWKTFLWLEKIFIRITLLLSEFQWAEIFHDQRLSIQVVCQIACKGMRWPDGLYFNEPPEWFIDG